MTKGSKGTVGQSGTMWTKQSKSSAVDMQGIRKQLYANGRIEIPKAILKVTDIKGGEYVDVVAVFSTEISIRKVGTLEMFRNVLRHYCKILSEILKEEVLVVSNLSVIAGSERSFVLIGKWISPHMG